jgi:hypothetical protein
LSPKDRKTLRHAMRSAPGGDLEVSDIEAAVELIVQRHVVAALTEAAEAIKGHYGGVTVNQVAGFRAGLDLAVSVVMAQTQRNLT